MDHRAVVETIRRLALEAGDLIMRVYDSPDFAVRRKDDQSPVTEADLAADAHIAAGLRAAFPDVPVVTEEDAATHRTDAASFFLVDPLDGTKEFVSRRGDFTVNIALVENGRPVLGAVYAPAQGRLFCTDASGGAVEENGAPRPIRVAAPDPDGLVVVASKSHRNKATDDYIARYRVREFRSAGSSLKFCLLAAGEADLYPRLGTTMEWDTAAGHAILLAAGGRVQLLDAPEDLTYGKPGFENPFFVAYAPGVAVIRN